MISFGLQISQYLVSLEPCAVEYDQICNARGIYLLHLFAIHMWI